MNLIQHFVDGKSISGESKRKGKVFDPSTGDQSSEVMLGTQKDLDNAVIVAKKAFEDLKVRICPSESQKTEK